MKAKKLIALILALVIALSLVACSAPAASEATSEAPSTGDSSEAESSSEETFDEPLYTLKYCHMNTETDDPGLMATYFAERVFELSKGAVKVEIFPNSTVGSIQEQAEMVAAGTMDINHSTWGGISPLCTTVELLDTPYLAANLDDALKLYNVQESPIIAEMNDLLVAESGVRIIGTGYGGSRMLTANKAILTPADLAGVKIRAIPSQVYMTAVEGMGAIAVAVDWADVPTALATGVADGQENPPVTIFNAGLQESQDFIMDTRHIISVGPMIMNDASLQKLPQEYQDIVLQAAQERDAAYAELTIKSEVEFLQKLQDAGMTYITAEDGLDVNAFKSSVQAQVAKDFPQYADYYAEINEYLGY